MGDLVLHLELDFIDGRDLKFGVYFFLLKPIFFLGLKNVVRLYCRVLKYGLIFSGFPLLLLCSPFCGVNILNFLEFYIIILLDVRVKAILDFILRTARQIFTYLRPLAANLAEKLKDFPVLFL